MHRLPSRYLWPVVLISGTLFALCIVTAVILFRQRAGMSESLRENIGSRRAAAELEEDLVNLTPLVRAGVRPDPDPGLSPEQR